MPVLHVIAGPNGVGKTALYDHFVSSCAPLAPFVDAQWYANSTLEHIADPDERNRIARDWADEERADLLAQRSTFVTRTVLSHPSRLELFTQAREAGYRLVLYAVGIDNARDLLQRVRERAETGGHGVPPEKVVDRYARSMANMRRAVSIVDLCVLIDGCDTDAGGPHLVATIRDQVLQTHMLPRPHWVSAMLGLDDLLPIARS